MVDQKPKVIVGAANEYASDDEPIELETTEELIKVNEEKIRISQAAL